MKSYCYCSLSYLKRLPIQTLKNDRLFIMGLPTDLDDVLIVNAVISMSSQFHLTLIAEGVEMKEQCLKTTLFDRS